MMHNDEGNSPQTVFIIDDDVAVRDAMSMLLESIGIPHQCFEHGEAFLGSYDPSLAGCLVVDIRMPGMSGLELQQALIKIKCSLPMIFITGHGDIPMAVETMRHGAMDFIRKPLSETLLIERIKSALAWDHQHQSEKTTQLRIDSQVNSLTEREREVFEHVAQGSTNRTIAFALNISERTVEVHRSAVMKKLNAKNLADVVRIHIAVHGP